MKNKYLLYIDILGFADLVSSNSDKVEMIYNIIDSLNVHSHNAFKTIVFSDTILVYNKSEPTNTKENQYFVMYAIEFIQDLTYHLADKDIYFRAILTYDKFKHYNLKNVECYFGDALINCYNKEKEVNGIGLFIDKRILNFNRIYPTTNYDNDLNFVSVLQCFERLSENTLGILPSEDLLTIDGTDEYWAIKFELNYLKNIYLNSINHSNSKVRGKFLQTYQLYKNLFKPILTEFEKTNFSYQSINENADWSIKRETYD
ncbi:hypothetical protein EC396_04290 [Lutibacter sp. HS1-25]|uniref:hypothetical protein n=1 Tax=Lutibacter sp. HS1-25 TaxID=2485000 RepID=UPI001010DDE7|nr:hypothetical protein [Lutibacter sp. HS1-25]RXP60879.1 hypothetical protein EC396_04290 [Lutibacter sp. HS1-25]